MAHVSFAATRRTTLCQIAHLSYQKYLDISMPAASHSYHLLPRRLIKDRLYLIAENVFIRASLTRAGYSLGLLQHSNEIQAYNTSHSILGHISA